MAHNTNGGEDAPNGPGFTRRHRPNGRWSTVTLNSGLIGGRVQAVLGAACGTSALLADLSPNLQSIRRARIRLFVALFVDGFHAVYFFCGAHAQLFSSGSMVAT